MVTSRHTTVAVAVAQSNRAERKREREREREREKDREREEEQNKRKVDPQRLRRLPIHSDLELGEAGPGHGLLSEEINK